MKEAIMKLKERWLGLAPREKKMLIMGAFFITFILVYFCLWSPLIEHVDKIRSEIVTNQKLLAFMREADKQIPADLQAKTNKPVSPMLLLSRVKKQIQILHLDQSIKGIKQTASNSIEMHFQKMDFNALLELLSSLEKTQNITLAKITVIALNDPGFVNADIYLK